MAQSTEISNRLEQLRWDLATRLERVRRDLRREAAPVDADWPDRAIQRENDEVLEELERTTAARLLQVEHALQRLLRGEYGVCEACGYGIEPPRLAAVPEATTCTSCDKLPQRRRAAT